MKGGKTYTVRFRAEVRSNTSINAEASVSITTISQDLQPRIAGAPEMKIGTVSQLLVAKFLIPTQTLLGL